MTAAFPAVSEAGTVIVKVWLASGQEQYNLSVSYQLPNKMLLSLTTNEVGDRQVRMGYTWGF